MAKKNPKYGRKLNVIPSRLKSKIERIRTRAKSAMTGSIGGVKQAKLTSLREEVRRVWRHQVREATGMDTNMTLAGILSAMRAGVVPPHQRDEELLAFLADCIEAAYKRDIGNAAAMRRVLLNAEARFASLALTNSEWRTCAEEHVREIAAALVATTRNCDRYRTEADAEDAFVRFCAKMRTGECKPWECPLRSTGGKYCFVTWLLGSEGCAG